MLGPDAHWDGGADMAHILDLGRRIELVSMDPHFHDISIGLYRRPSADSGPEFLVHTYAGGEGVVDRIGFVAQAMRTLGGMETAGEPHAVRFPCGAEHSRACKRVFVEACKIQPGVALEVRPLSIFDKKCAHTIAVTGAGGGAYRLGAEDRDEATERRIGAVGGGLVKLAEIEALSDNHDCVAFQCGHAHDALVGLLLVRALNVRASFREQEAAAARGVLAAPSAQDS